MKGIDKRHKNIQNNRFLGRVNNSNYMTFAEKLPFQINKLGKEAFNSQGHGCRREAQ